MDEKTLMSHARDAALNAYAPYSEYRVGAALLSEDGQLVTGANVENASYGLTLCAERVALAAATARGIRRFKTIAVFAAGESYPHPCGACLQMMSELAPGLRILLGRGEGEPVAYSLPDLLPHPFAGGGEME